MTCLSVWALKRRSMFGVLDAAPLLTDRLTFRQLKLLQALFSSSVE